MADFPESIREPHEQPSDTPQSRVCFSANLELPCTPRKSNRRRVSTVPGGRSGGHELLHYKPFPRLHLAIADGFVAKLLNVAIRDHHMLLQRGGLSLLD